MPIQSLWIHGNTLKSEHEDAIEKISYQGWGADINLSTGRSGWFHIPLSAPAGNKNYSVLLHTISLLYYSWNCEIREIHVYDGSIKIQSFEDLHLSGEHRFLLNNNNRFPLKTPHPVFCGIGLSFFCVANLIDTEDEVPRLIIASAGIDYSLEEVKKEVDETDEDDSEAI